MYPDLDCMNIRPRSSYGYSPLAFCVPLSRVAYILISKFKSRKRILISNLHSGKLPGAHRHWWKRNSDRRFSELWRGTLSDLNNGWDAFGDLGVAGYCFFAILPQVEILIHYSPSDRPDQPYSYAMCTHRRFVVQLQRTVIQFFSVRHLNNDNCTFRLPNTSKLPCCEYITHEEGSRWPT